MAKRTAKSTESPTLPIAKQLIELAARVERLEQWAAHLYNPDTPPVSLTLPEKEDV